MTRRNLAWLALSAVIAAQGCGEPQLADAEEQDYRLIMQLNAALASKQEALLAETAERLKSRHEQGKIPASAYQSLESMIEQAKSGEWEQAHRRCLDFMKGQKGSRNLAR